MIGLSLAGGGVKGSYEVGVYLAMKKCHIANTIYEYPHKDLWGYFIMSVLTNRKSFKLFFCNLNDKIYRYKNIILKYIFNQRSKGINLPCSFELFISVLASFTDSAALSGGLATLSISLIIL